MNPTSRFESLYEQEYDAVYAFCARRVGRADAGDAAAEVFTVAWRRREAIPADAGRAWIFGVARNTVLNAWRSQRRRSGLLRRVRSVRAVEPLGPEHAAVQNDEARAVLAALRTLRSTDQEVLIMSAWDGLAAAEIAEILDLSPTAVHQRLHRAKQRLGRALEPAGSALRPERSPERGAR